MGQIEDGGPSVTARRVAAHRLGFTRVPAAYGDPAADEALAADVVLESVLGQFRQVAAPGSRLAISVSLSGKGDDRTRARFQTAVAALGKPARSALEAGEAETLLAPPTTERPARAAANGPTWLVSLAMWRTACCPPFGRGANSVMLPLVVIRLIFSSVEFRKP